MKPLFVALFTAVLFTAHARIITVSNSPLNPGQFPSVNLSMSIANTGDTIFVQGSPISYGSFDLIRDGIVVIGPGHTPQKQFPFVALFTDITIDGNNCQLIGLVAQSVTAHFRDFTMRRCKILGSAAGAAVNRQVAGFGTLLLEGNVFTGGVPNLNLSDGSGDNITIRNNVFSSSIDLMEQSTPTSLLLSNNIFLRGPLALNNITHATVNNNIFYGSSPLWSGGATIIANNNITFQCSANFFPTGPFITLSNNLENVDPQFVNYPGGSAVFSFLHDYHLAAGSPGLASGTDGTDRGVYGGFGPIFNMTGEPAIAEVSSVAITSPTTIAPGGTLNVTVVSRRVH